MRIKEVYIQRYWTLRPFHAKFEKNASIIFGPGGSGKTLIIDAILKMLLGNESFEFIRHKEVDETPSGYVIVEKGGKEFKLGEEKHLSDIPGLEIDPIELKNIFVIQDADLEISDEDKFYGRITSKLIGVRTEDIRKIKEGLRRRGRLTPKLEIISKHPYKVGEKLSDAKELRENIKEYLDKAKSEGIDRLEKEKFDLGWNLKRLGENIDLLEKARKKSEFDKLEASLKKAKNNLQALKTLPDKTRISQLSVKFLDLRKEKEKLPQLERETNSWKQRFTYSIISTAIAFIALMVFSLQLASTFIPSILFLASMFSLYKWQQLEKSIAQIETMKQSIVMEAHNLGLGTKTMEEVEEEVKGISKRIEDEEASFNRESGILGKDLQINESDPEKLIEKAQSALTKLRSSVNFDVSVAYDEEELEKAKAQKRSTDESLRETEKKLQEHQKNLQVFSEKALRLQFVDEFSNFKLDFEIKNLDSLEKLGGWLNPFIEQIEKDAEFSREAFEIFEELESKEDAKSENLFGKESRASKIFRGITSGMFEEISYDSSTGEILVRRSHENRLQKASELSRSEWTQLYMAIRVALGESLLKGEEGFFIVEEPFIHADSERLMKEFDVLKNLSKRSWQTLYFTAKDEIKERLPKQMDAGIIKLERLP